MNILGISALYHDSAAALIVDGKIVAAAQEERFTRKKHDSAFPVKAIEYCLQEAGITHEEIDYVAFYEKPYLKFERLLETYLAYAPSGFASFRQAIPAWLREKLHTRRVIKKGLGKDLTAPLVFAEHHEAHAASAFFPSPFDEAAVLTVDGVGEWATSTIAVGEGNKLKILQEQRFPHSLGLLYSAFTYYCGFRINSGEYKLMGLAPYGKPIYAEKIKKHLLDIKEDSSFRMDMQYFNYCEGLTMTGKKFHELFGRPPRKAEAELDQFYMDVAASVQQVTEELMLAMARHAKKLTGKNKLCLAGGVALNCVANGKILREGPFDEIWIQPAAGDAGGALGAAQLVWFHYLDNERIAGGVGDQGNSWFGPAFGLEETKEFLDQETAVYEVCADEDDLCDKVAQLIADEKVIGWFQDRMEFGPRALGARSILGDARSEKMQRTMNLKIKFRESFRPFAPVILKEKVDEYFEMEPNQDSPYMLLVAPVQESKRTKLNDEDAALEGLIKLNQKRSVVPAITHVDMSARVQTADERHNAYHKLVKAFYEKEGSPVLINTSFNVRGEPIVCTPENAFRCFMGTDMDVLVLGNIILKKEDQPNQGDLDNSKYLEEFALD
ncbi:carbamoyltransferase [Akkermansiaceae bacterium]|jgi:carbamoyltransferase|nr:carbamoyltransferase [Akkermansiaceae bacterium]|tara:strand:+ start:122 stop:1954 length:1833 start_codon:yes stop_codon:yes gene_type:complete